MKKSFEFFYRKFRSQSDRPLDNIDDIVAFVQDSFDRMTQPWLMVFDNYDNPKATDIQPYMSFSKIGSVLITTRHADVKRFASPGLAIELEALDDPDAAKLLLDSAGFKRGDSSEDIVKQNVNRLSNHALAIIQAGAYMSKKKLPLAKFLDCYNQRPENILRRALSRAEYNRQANDKDISLDVFATWELSFQQLQVEEGPKGFKEDLLTILGCWNANDNGEPI